MSKFEQMMQDILTKYNNFRNWDKIRPTSECRHCLGTGVAPGDGNTECGFCVKDDSVD